MKAPLAELVAENVRLQAELIETRHALRVLTKLAKTIKQVGESDHSIRQELRIAELEGLLHAAYMEQLAAH